MYKKELTLHKLNENGLKCNIEQSFFGQIKITYLGLWVACDEVKKSNKNI